MRSKPIKRFSRRLEGAEAAALEKLTWNLPEFRPQIVPDEHAIDFTFRISILHPPKRYRVLSTILFGLSSETWERALRIGYCRLRYGDRNVEKSIAMRLHSILQAGIQEYLEGSWDTDGVLQKATGIPTTRRIERDAFDTGSKIKANQPNPKLALQLALTKQRYLIGLTRLERRMEDMKGMSDRDLYNEISKNLPYDVFLGAWREFTRNPRSTPRSFLNHPQLSNEVFVEAMLKTKLKKANHDPKKMLVKTYIALGNQIVRSLSTLPKRLR